MKTTLTLGGLMLALTACAPATTGTMGADPLTGAEQVTLTPGEESSTICTEQGEVMAGDTFMTPAMPGDETIDC
ncbi:MAG: hypothetical protein ACU0BF_04690 [Paracoccaceae bacterium]